MDLDSESSWFEAKTIASQLDPIPQSVSSAVSVLWANHLDNIRTGEKAVHTSSDDSIRRMERTSKLKTPIYFAAQSLYPDKFEQGEDDTTKALLRALQPGLFASILGLVYLHRRLNKICTAGDWQSLSKEMVLNMEVGFLTGSSFPALGPALGTLLGGIRFAALAAILRKHPDHYGRYRNLRKNKFDLEDEHVRWGCDHAQIAAYLLQKLGFRKDIVDAGLAMRTIDKGLERLPPDLQVWRAALVFFDAVRDGRTNPDNKIYADVLKATPETLRIFDEKINKLLQTGSTFSWMFKSSGDSEGA